MKGTVSSLFEKCFLKQKLSPLCYNLDIQGKQNVHEDPNLFYRLVPLITMLCKIESIAFRNCLERHLCSSYAS